MVKRKPTHPWRGFLPRDEQIAKRQQDLAKQVFRAIDRDTVLAGERRRKQGARV